MVLRTGGAEWADAGNEWIGIVRRADDDWLGGTLVVDGNFEDIEKVNDEVNQGK